MYRTLTANPEAFEALIGLNPIEFCALYHAFGAAWQAREAERRMVARRQAAPGVGRKFVVGKPDQLLSVLLWSHLRLHPKQISRLLGVHPSTFARIRQRVLALLDHIDAKIALPGPADYKEIDQIAQEFPELQHLV